MLQECFKKFQQNALFSFFENLFLKLFVNKKTNNQSTATFNPSISWGVTLE